MHSEGSYFLLLWVNCISLCSSSSPLSLPPLISFLTATSTFTSFQMKSLVLFPKTPYSSPTEGRYEWNILKSVRIHELLLCFRSCVWIHHIRLTWTSAASPAACNLLQCNNIGGLGTTMSSSECWYSRAPGTFWCKAASSGWSVIIKWQRQWCYGLVRLFLRPEFDWAVLEHIFRSGRSSPGEMSAHQDHAKTL